jgi:hypothetical protein
MQMAIIIVHSDIMSSLRGRGSVYQKMMFDDKGGGGYVKNDECCSSAAADGEGQLSNE